MSYKLMQHSKNSRLYYADADGIEELLNEEGTIQLGDRVYLVSSDEMYYGGSDGKLYLENAGTEYGAASSGVSD